MDIPTVIEHCDYEISRITKTSFYTEKIKMPSKQTTIKFTIRQWIKKMLLLR
jgi:hypothetical protein